MIDHVTKLIPVATVIRDHLHISRSLFYREVRAGKIALAKIGASSFVCEDELARYIRDLPRVTGKA